MSSDNCSIRVDGLSKCYHIYDRGIDRLKQAFIPPACALAGLAPRAYYREFWALKDISFEVMRGETVGIIGRNGSGKSTLLQVICGILTPTAGTVETHGRVAAMLELGAGFNPQFTGRENIYMNGMVLGLSQADIDDRFDDITAFADIGDFIEQPVKHYSSGMYARLAFSVAISVDPDILVVDEALAVGDETFQRKCYARINEIKKYGGTIFFVSHASNTIAQLCDKSILLDNGKQLYFGPPQKTLSLYHKILHSPFSIDQNNTAQDHITQPDAIPTSARQKTHNTTLNPVPTTQTIKNSTYFDAELTSESMTILESNGAVISNTRIVDGKGHMVNCLKNGESYHFCYDVEFSENSHSTYFFNAIKTITGVELGGAHYPSYEDGGINATKNETITVSFNFNCSLNPGVYFFNCGVQGPCNKTLHRIIDALCFRVIPQEHETYAFGYIDLQYSASVKSTAYRNHFA